MAHQSAAPRTPRPGDLLLHPTAVLAVVVLVINDHLLKPLAPGLLSGKLSDFAGLLFFPLLLASVVEVAALVVRRPPPDRRSLALGAIVATGLAFAVVKTTTAGSLAFGWSVGIAQWLASVGPLRGGAAQPIAVATDPGDLVALAALAGAWFVAGGSQAVRPPRRTWRFVEARRAPSRPATLMLVVASLATMATGRSVQEQQSMVTWDELIHLDDDNPAVSRHLSYDVDTRGDAATSIGLWPEIHPYAISIAAKPAMTLTVLPDEPTGGASAGDLTKTCNPTCHSGATLVVRLTGAAPEGVDLTLYAALIAFTDASAPKFEPSLALRNDDALAFNGSPSSQVVMTQGTFHVTTAKPKAKQGLEIRIDAAALKAPLEYPLVATMETYLQTTDIERSSIPAGNLTVGTMKIPLVTGLPYTSTAVLSMCKAGQTCLIPVRIESDYSGNLTVVDPPSTPRAGSADLVWRIRVRLEAFDGRKLPADAVSISKTSR